MMWSYLVIEV